MTVAAALIIVSYHSYYGQTYHSERRETCLVSACLGQMIFATQGSYSAVCVCVVL